MCGDGGTPIQKPRQESINEHGDRYLSAGVVHAPDTDARLGQVGVRLNEVAFAEGQRDGNFLELAV